MPDSKLMATDDECLPHRWTWVASNHEFRWLGWIWSGWVWFFQFFMGGVVWSDCWSINTEMRDCGCNHFVSTRRQLLVRISYIFRIIRSSSLYHSVARECLHCCKSDQLSLWSNAKFGVSEPQAPEPINTKFGMDDSAGDINPHAKIHNNRPSGGVPAHA